MMEYPRYEWLYDDTRLILYDWLIGVHMIHPEATHYYDRFALRKCEDEFIAQMAQENITAVFVKDIPRTVNGKYQKGYWVLSFKNTQQTTLFKLKYAHAF